MKKHILFYKPTCPFCAKVLDFASSNSIEFDLQDITSASAIAEELIRVGGKRQVPCLLVDGMGLYESDDIINWLKDHDA